jgi:hypothetical protein
LSNSPGTDIGHALAALDTSVMDYHTFAREAGEPATGTDPFPLVAAAFLDDVGPPSAALPTQEPVAVAAQHTTAPVTETSATFRALAPEASPSLRPGAGTRSPNPPDADWTRKLGFRELRPTIPAAPQSAAPAAKASSSITPASTNPPSTSRTVTVEAMFRILRSDLTATPTPPQRSQMTDIFRHLQRSDRGDPSRSS